MFVAALIVLGLWNGAYVSTQVSPRVELTCAEKVDRACRLNSVLEKSLPGTLEELEKECLTLQEYKKCMITTLGECDGAEYDEISIMESGLSKDTLKLLNLFTEICHKDTNLHTRFVQDLACLKEVVDAINEDQNCDGYGISSSSQRSTDRMSVDGRRIYSDENYCQRVLSNMNCFLSRFVDQCGRLAKDTAVELIQKGGSLDEQCPKDVRRDVLHKFNLWEKQTGKPVHVHELFS